MKLLKRLSLLAKDYRELVFHLALKNLKIQYKYAFLGFLWAFFVPLCMALVFWFIFSFLFKRPTGPLALITALFVWQFINMSIASSTTSIVDGGGLLKKIYFPREIVPISFVLSNFINFVLSIVVLVVFVFVYNLVKGVWPIFPWYIVFLPPLVLLTLIMTTGIVLLTSCLQVFYRDVRYIVEIVLLVWFYFSGVFYEVDLIAGGAASKGMPWMVTLFMLNPLYDLFTLYRMVILPKASIVDISLYYNVLLMVAQCIAFSIAVFAAAYYYFLKKENELVDLI